VGTDDRDFVEATTAENARLREIAGRVEARMKPSWPARSTE
jgi:hypothetical protein